MTRSRFTRRALTIAIALTLAPGLALAQTRKAPAAKTDRGAIYVNGGYQTGTSNVENTTNFTANVETGTFTTKFKPKPGVAFDAGGRVRVWRQLSVGLAVTSYTANGNADVSANVPHPFFFNQPRAISGQAALDRKETAVHLRLAVASRPGTKLQFTGFAGPSYFSLTQGLVDRVNYSDSYPFDTATFTGATTRSVSKSRAGFNAGADIAYFFSKQVGVGLSAMVAKATFHLAAVDNSSVSVTAGGAIIGLGLRVRF